MNFFKKLFENKKKDKTRQNLIVSIDDHVTGDHEVLTIKTTSGSNIIIEFNGQTNKMAVNPNDLQDALNRVKDFMDARPGQPAAQQPLGVKHLEATKEQVLNNEDQVKQLEKQIKPVLDLTN